MDVNATANFLERSGGDRIKLRRQTGKGLYIEVECAARVTKFTPERYAFIAAAGGIAQGDRLCVISDREIAAKRWPGPPRRGDVVIIEGEGNTTLVQGCDTSSVDNVTCRHDIQIRGGG
jgi:hypothetical protein